MKDTRFDCSIAREAELIPRQSRVIVLVEATFVPQLRTEEEAPRDTFLTSCVDFERPDSVQLMQVEMNVQAGAINFEKGKSRLRRDKGKR